uniref:Putative secreted protein n=1 Tax=Amblyomma parvum TaxID=251391 RepID=A0A023FZF2_AMBPA
MLFLSFVVRIFISLWTLCVELFVLGCSSSATLISAPQLMPALCVMSDETSSHFIKETACRMPSGYLLIFLIHCYHQNKVCASMKLFVKIVENKPANYVRKSRQETHVNPGVLCISGVAEAGYSSHSELCPVLTIVRSCGFAVPPSKASGGSYLPRNLMRECFLTASYGQLQGATRNEMEVPFLGQG